MPLLMPARAAFRRAGPAGAAAPSHSLQYRNSLHVLPNASFYNWSSQSIGTANADRVVIVAGYAGGDATLGLSVDVGGNAATEIAQDANSESMFAFYVIVSSGTTATIAFSSATTLRIIDAGYWTCLLPVGEALYNEAHAISSGQNFSQSINIPANGFAITVGFERANLADMTMAVNQSFVERAEDFGSGTTNSNMAFADREVTSALSALSVQWSLNATTSKNGMIIASFGA